MSSMFPVEPVFPRPMPIWQPLFPEIMKNDLSRFDAAAKVVVGYYKLEAEGGRSTKAIADVIEHSIRSYSSREDGSNFDTIIVGDADADPKEFNNKLRDLYEICHKRFLVNWVRQVTDVGVRGALEVVVDELLHPSIFNLYRPSRSRGLDVSSNKSEDGKSIKQYKFFVNSKLLRTAFEECKLDFWKSGGDNEAKFWDKRWRRQEEKRHYARNLLASPEGLSDVLALLFFKLFHLQMACVAPRSRKKDSVDWLYKPLLNVISRCARHAENEDCYPLAPLALKIYTSLAYMDLESTGGFNGLINPRKPELPDCLNVDVLSSMKTCVEEAKAMLRDNKESLEVADTKSLEDIDCLVEDVALLAWDVSSSRCDPFMLGGWGNVQRLTDLNDGAQRISVRGFDHFCFRWDDDQKALVSKEDSTKRNRIPESFFCDKSEGGSVEDIAELRVKFLFRLKTLKRYFDVIREFSLLGLRDYQS